MFRVVKQAFLNIFLNSIQSMPNGGRLEVSTSRQGDKVDVLIKDSGCGIQDKDIPKVFDPFFSTRESGTGLGLSIVHGIIQKHGGKIEIKSKAGAGTSVSVALKSRN
jgi:signal transduction histidine kinase